MCIKQYYVLICIAGLMTGTVAHAANGLNQVRKANVVFTRGKFVVYVEAGANIDADPEARKLTILERSDREKTEVQRLSKEFAHYTVSALDAP